MTKKSQGGDVASRRARYTNFPRNCLGSQKRGGGINEPRRQSALKRSELAAATATRSKRIAT